MVPLAGLVVEALGLPVVDPCEQAGPGLLGVLGLVVALRIQKTSLFFIFVDMESPRGRI